MKPIRPQGAPRATRASAIALEDCRFFLAHEMRTPLVALDMAIARAGLPQAAGDPARLAQMRSAVRTLREQSDALLVLVDLATRPLVPTAVDLTAVFRRAADDLGRRFADRAVALDIEAGLQCTADMDVVTLLAACLLDNAWKFTAMTAGAAVRVSRGGEAGGAAGLSRFEVCDNGAGFDPEAAGSLFHAFRRLHSAKRFPGLGTGLAAVRIAVERHGGKVDAQGSPGAGCRIAFSLPAPAR